MSSHPVPANEEERLALLDSLALTPAGELGELQALARVASHIAGTPIALVSLVGRDDQVFAANVGLPGINGTRREAAFCAHAIVDGGQLIVPDTTKDPRFADNPLVTGFPDIRAYAGSVLEPEEGLRLGTLCVIDTRPRQFSEDVLAMLCDLSRTAATLLVAHRDRRRLARELDAAKLRNSLLRQTSELEPLTGLLNQATFRERVDETIGTARTDSALVLIDVDHFKQVNDRFGHPFGDEYLKAIANSIRAACGTEAITSRIGGDEFAAFLQPDALDDTRSILARMRNYVRASAAELGQPQLGELSIGLCALSEAPRRTFEALYQRADIALYASKDRGRNRTTQFNCKLDAIYNIRSQQARMADALTRDRIEPFFQPIIGRDTGEIVSFEILVRWRDEDGSVRPPGEFWQMLTDRALGPQITHRMVTGGIEAQRAWRARGARPVRLAINATIHDLSDPDFVDNVEWQLFAADLEWSDFIIEVTETVMLGQRDDQVYKTMTRIRERGGIVSLDDFGTGFAGLAHLRDWPINAVKIDRSFIQNITHDEKNHAIVASITDLAHRLGLIVVAEGIESQEAANMLLDIGCDRLQGFHFSEPVEADRAFEMLMGSRIGRSA